MCEAVASPSDDRLAALEHEPILLRARDEDVACFDSQAAPEGRRHDQPALAPDRDFDRFPFCHRSSSVPHKLE
jgi:hypothetical protein